ncbi:stage IV sporulation protein FB [Lysinibacillus antri]|uniref:Stage IV sporulation protein FB n=1 Tax=Lysinibacillus antri TaxID=2498145 RepID=A0A432LGP5_9BACI|nr:stage IV sporulation protein FB [Lysinibacillus antri]TSI03398.1 stage IV sporulation protein FB [Lysinibacillus sp. BW-2-10]
MVIPFLDPLLAEPLIKIQLVLLAVNMIPVWPLDGGRIVLSFILMFYPKARLFEMYLSVSLLLTILTIIITFIMLPKTLFLLVLSIFIFIKLVSEWRYRKYRLAFEKYVMNRLT